MHMKLLVIVPKECAESSEDARDYVSSYLNDNGFAGDGGRFNSPVADWYVIGGRWSGCLTKARLDKEKVKAFDKEFEEKYGYWINSQNSEEKRRGQAQELFNKYFPDFKGLMPFWRDSYNDSGAEDDAQIVDEELWEKAIKDCDLNETPDYYSGNACILADCGYDVVTKESAIGNWIVVVDFHD